MTFDTEKQLLASKEDEERRTRVKPEKVRVNEKGNSRLAAEVQ